MNKPAYKAVLIALYMACACTRLWGQCSNCPTNVTITEGATTKICPNATKVLHATTGLASYLWEDGTTTSTHTITGPGTYWVSSIHNGCQSCDTILVTLFPAPPQVILNPPGPTVSACEGDTVILAVANPVYASYLWNFQGHTENKLYITDPGIYWVMARDGNGCMDTSGTVQVGFNQLPVPALGNDTVICSNVVLGLNPGNFAHYLWNTGDTVPVLFADTSGYFLVTVTAANGCKNSDGIFITELAAPTIDLGPDLLLCGGQSAILDAGSGHSNYRWENGETTQTRDVASGGWFWVQTTNSNGCTSNRDSLYITYDLLSPPGILYSNGDLNVATFSSYQWYRNDTLIQGATLSNYLPPGEGIYRVLVTNSNGCSILSQPYELTTLVTVLQGFSPNGDGIGDFFTIENIAYYPANELKIFNRWGNMVFERIGYANNWNGESLEGQKLPDGTYFFTLDLKNGKEAISDYIILNR